MALQEELEQQGIWLFKRRSEFPLLVVALMLLELWLAPPAPLAPVTEAVWAVVCLAIAFGGEAIRASTVGRVPGGTSARQTREPGSGELNTSGWYSVVRHPLYLGNFLIWFGLALWLRSWEFGLVVALAFWVYYERIMYAEEAYLRRRFGESYLDWAARTPAFLPRLAGWQPASLPFSWRVVVRREHSSIFAIVATFTAEVYLRDLLGGGRVAPHVPVAAFFTLGLVFFLAAVMLTRHTALLEVEGR
jgi:protein-S-isoprenylcysteine O-methyltransferase Ste14